MARVKQNALIKGLSGRIGKSIVFKTYGNVTVVSAYPDMSNVKLSAKQKTENKKFKEAMAYAKSQMADPTAKALYKAKTTGMQKPHNLAIADFYHPPEIGNVVVSIAQQGKADQISIEAKDDFMVVKVEVEILRNDGRQHEIGNAQEIRENKWQYVVQRVYPSAEGLNIIVRAWDRPGNCTEKVM